MNMVEWFKFSSTQLDGISYCTMAFLTHLVTRGRLGQLEHCWRLVWRMETTMYKHLRRSKDGGVTDGRTKDGGIENGGITAV